MDRKDNYSYLSLKSSIKNERIDKSKDDNERYSRKRTISNHSDIQSKSNVDAKVYVGNVPTDHLTDRDLLDFFKPYGKISDIRVYKGYLFIQFDKVIDAKNLIKEGRKSLIFKGKKLDILPAMDGNIKESKPSSFDQYYSNESRRYLDNEQNSIDYQPPRKRIAPDHSRNSNENPSTSSYTILKEPNDKTQTIHCRIILVNHRQKDYAEEISSRLYENGMLTSIILLREQTTLAQAIEDTIKGQYLYGILLMSMHQQRNTISFHILHGKRQEYRNIGLDEGLNIIFKDFEESLSNDKPKFSNENYPLSMLLCLLADGRQLTLYEIDRILSYLLEKKASMLTLPQGTLPPLPFQYSTKINPTRSNDNCQMIEQIEQILSKNFKTSSEPTNQFHSNIYPTLPNTAAADAAAAIFQAYSQFNIPTAHL